MVVEGDDVILPCALSDGSIRALEWTRPDLTSPENIFFFCDGRLDNTYQTSSFRDRVQLVDSGPKLQDLSLRVRNVTSRDKGTYECRVAAGRTGATRHKRAMISNDPLSVITLEVTGERGALTHVQDLRPFFWLLMCALICRFPGQRPAHRPHRKHRSVRGTGSSVHAAFLHGWARPRREIQQHREETRRGCCRHIGKPCTRVTRPRSLYT